MSKIVVVTSGKGGVGKTTTSAAISAGLAKRGKKTAVIDFDVGLRNLDLIMGCERRVVYDFVNVIQGDADMDADGEYEAEYLGDEEDAEGAEEYVVEAIVNHFQEDRKKYYLVKWDGYEDSHDWLPEEDLGGAADLVAEYNERLGGKNKKVKLR